MANFCRAALNPDPIPQSKHTLTGYYKSSHDSRPGFDINAGRGRSEPLQSRRGEVGDTPILYSDVVRVTDFQPGAKRGLKNFDPESQKYHFGHLGGIANNTRNFWYRVKGKFWPFGRRWISPRGAGGGGGCTSLVWLVNVSEEFLHRLDLLRGWGPGVQPYAGSTPRVPQKQKSSNPAALDFFVKVLK